MEILTGMFLLVVFFAFVLVARQISHQRLNLSPVTPNKESHLALVKSSLEENPYSRKSGVELARMIREGETTSEEVTSAHISHIDAVNPHLNAVVAFRYREALEEARRCDEEIRKKREKGTDDLLSSLPPFFGVPCTVKECFALEGMPQASGLVSRKHFRAQADAPAVANLRAAGAIPMGVTNTSELCMWMESANKLYGRTRNPFDPTRIVGGSSGGEGAIVGAGASPFGIGSDIGGSIRMPAFFNGVFGHKPSPALVPNAGQHPVAVGPAERYLTTGPIARRAVDLWPLLQVMQGKSVGEAKRSPSDVDLSRLTVYWLDSNEAPLAEPVAVEMKHAIHHAVEHLQREHGCQVEHAKDRLHRLKHSLDIWSSMMHVGNEASTFEEMLANGDKGFKAWRELLVWLFRGTSDFTLPALGLCLIERLPDYTPERTAAFVEKGRQLKAQVEALLSEDSILLFPSYPSPAPKHSQPIFRPINWQYTGIWNMVEVPVTQVPMGLSRGRQLPLGVQVVGAQGCDHVTIAVALALEQGHGGWCLPSLLGVADDYHHSCSLSDRPEGGEDSLATSSSEQGDLEDD